MKHPYGTCPECGERLYGHIDGDYQCLNCKLRYAPADVGLDCDDGGSGLEVPAP